TVPSAPSTAATFARRAPRLRTAWTTPAIANGKTTAARSSHAAAAFQRPPCAAAASSCGPLLVESVGETRVPASRASGKAGRARAQTRRRRVGAFELDDIVISFRERAM